MVRSVLALSATLAFGVAGLAGCAHETAEDRQLADLSRGVEMDQAAIDKMEPRIDEKSQLAKVPAALSDTVPASRRGNVVRYGDSPEPAPPGDDALNGEDPNDTTPRPVIRIVGVRPARRGVPGVDHIDEVLPDEPANGGQAGPPIRSGAPAPSALSPEALHAYDSALALVNAHQYDQALDAFAAFLVRWPDHPNADNAMYWRGECYFARGDYRRAAEQFEGVVARFPAGAKAPDALLKLGMSQQRLGDATKAKDSFDRLTQLYPQSDAARRIPPVTATVTTPRGPAPEDHR
jgi:tol-pal system protein YbgF